MSTTSPSGADFILSGEEALSSLPTTKVEKQTQAYLEGIPHIAAETFRVPVALLCLVEGAQTWSTLAPDQPALNQAVLELCRRPIHTKSTIVVPDLSDSRWADTPGLSQFRFFAGTPVQPGNGPVVATLCLLDNQPRTFSESQRRLLEQLGALAADQMERLALVGRLQIETQARQAAANAYVASESRFRSMVENASDIITVLAADGTVLFESPSLKSVLGYAPEDLAGKNVFEYLHPGDVDAAVAAFEELVKNRRDSRLITFRFRHQDGSWRTLEAIGSNRLDDPAVAGIVINSRDVTERTASEALLHASNQRFQSAFNESAIGIALVSPQGRWLSVNRALCEFLGYSETELLNIDFQTVTHPEDLDGDLELVSRVLKGELQTYTMEKRYFHRDGHLVWALLTVSLVRDTSGVPLHFISQVQDISGRKAAEKSLLEARDEAERQRQIAELARAEAEAANQAKSEFLSRISHELRTPLNAILGFGQLLELSNLSAADRQSVTHILKGGRQLLSLINEVLDIARFESGALALSPEPVSVAQVGVEALDLVRPLASQRGIILVENGIRDNGTYVLADRQRLKQVMVNLLSNAIKYNRPDGVVNLRVETLTAKEGESAVRLVVEDTGAGIAADKLERLFTPFDRLGAEVTEEEGTGIALALSLRLATAMKGQLGVESTEGIGSSFWIQLPQTTNPIDEMQSEDEAVDNDMPISTRWVVLCIEDNLPTLQLLNQVFSRRPAIRLLSASQGPLGLELAKQHYPDLILLDLHVPEMGGEDVLERLRSDPRTASIPIIVISADASPNHMKKLLETGATAYLTKPFDVTHLLDTVDNLLAVRATARQRQDLQVRPISTT